MTKGWTRRDFLSGLGASAGLSALGGMHLFNHPARAADDVLDPLPDRYFLVLEIYGGWDLLLSLDPRDPAVFTQDNIGQTLIQPHYSHLLTPPAAGVVVDTQLGLLGGYMDETLAHLDKVCIVRGMSMETLAHATARRRMATGRVPDGVELNHTTIDVWLSAWLGKNDIIPNIAISRLSKNTNQPGYATPMRINRGAQLYPAMARETPFSVDEESAIQAFLLGQQSCASAQASGMKVQASSSRETIAALMQQNLGEKFNLKSKDPEMVALREHYTVQQNPYMATPLIAAQAIKAGLSRVVGARLSIPSLDDHGPTWARDNGPNQRMGFNAYARVLEDLESSPHPSGDGSWLDRTTVILTSEFSRGPLMNVAEGRDHWLMNGMILAGGDIKGGQVIGASSDVGMFPMPVDLKTGAVDLLNGHLLRPDDIWHTLFHSIGIEGDPANLKGETLKALLK